jgi:hypothetical protein
VDDLLAHIDRRSVQLKRHLNGLDRPVNPGAIAPGPGKQDTSGGLR